NTEGTFAAPRLTMLSGTLSGSSTISISPAATITGGTLLGPGIINLPGINFPNGQFTVNNRTVSVSGVTVQGTGVATAQMLVQNGGVVNNLAGSSWTLGGSGSNGIFNNGGTGNIFNNSGSFTNANTATAATTISTTFSNSGDVSANAGTKAFTAFTQTAGSVVRNGGRINGTPAAPAINVGLLGGNGAIGGFVNVNGGTTSPGFSPGQISISGTYTQSATSTYAAEIGGLTAGTQYDQI